jgi:hypothetical protein
VYIYKNKKPAFSAGIRIIHVQFPIINLINPDIMIIIDQLVGFFYTPVA